MAKRSNKAPVISVTSCLTVVVFAMIIFIALFVLFAIRGGADHSEKTEGATLMTVIPAPTLTPTVYATAEPVTLDVHYVSVDGLSVGAIVEISGTENTGLSIRPEPGLGGWINFVAGEGERFEIVDGPDAKNDYTWWKLQGVNDEERSGWAVSEYLKLIRPAE